MKLMSPKEAILENPLSIFEFVAHGEVVLFSLGTSGLKALEKDPASKFYFY
jgi:hypothetical protein